MPVHVAVTPAFGPDATTRLQSSDKPKLPSAFDVDVYIKRTVGYVIMTAVVALGYFSVQTVVSTVLLKPLFGAQAEHFYPVIFALLVVFFFEPINRRVQSAVDRMFFRKGYDYKATVAAMSDALTSMLDLDRFLGKVIQTVRQDLFVDRAGVVLLDSRQNRCQALFNADAPEPGEEPPPDPCLSHDDPLLALLAREQCLITKYDIEEGPQYVAVREACGRSFSQLGASLALPLFHGREFTGILAVGYKKSGHFYSRDDIDLLKTVSTMTATAI